MWANILVLAFVLMMAFAYSTQGLFSATLHLLLTILAGAFAFAVWEPVVYGLLIERMPEMAWGVGLLAPFVLALLILRETADRLILGNLDFPYLANAIGGAALGFAAAVLTAGIVIIGLQFTAGTSLGYQPYSVDASGEFERTGKLWIPVDDIAGSVFTTFSAGSLHPILSDENLASRHPDITREAGLFHMTSRPNARVAARPGNFELTGRFDVPGPQVNETAESVRLAGDSRLLVVETTLDLIGEGETAGIADKDRYFTATRGQVAVLAEDPETGEVTAVYPIGFEVGQDFGTLRTAGEFARSKPGVEEQVMRWLFEVPRGYDASFFRLKQVRKALPEPNWPQDKIDSWLAGVDWKPAPPEVAENGDGEDNGSTDVGPRDGLGADVQGMKAYVSDELPATFNINTLHSRCRNVQVNRNPDTGENELVTAIGTVETERGRPGRNIAVSKIFHVPAMAIVQVEMEPSRARSLFGQAVQAAAQQAPPLVITESGDIFRATGFTRATRGSVELHFTDRTIRALSQLNTQNIDDDETVTLYFPVARGSRVTEFQVGRSTQELNVPVR